MHVCDIRIAGRYESVPAHGSKLGLNAFVTHPAPGATYNVMVQLPDCW